MTTDHAARTRRVMEACGCLQITGLMSGNHLGWSHNDNKIAGPNFDPFTNIADAWVVMELMRELGWQYGMNDSNREHGVDGHYIVFHRPLNERSLQDGRSLADTAPLAIMLAAERALGVAGE